jgi:hypothetical protein
MSIDPHWFSTLFDGMFLQVFCKLNHHDSNGYLYLKSRGFLEYVNTSHIHDLAKFMFGFSVFGLTGFHSSC